MDRHAVDLRQYERVLQAVVSEEEMMAPILLPGIVMEAARNGVWTAIRAFVQHWRDPGRFILGDIDRPQGNQWANRLINYTPLLRRSYDWIQRSYGIDYMWEVPAVEVTGFFVGNEWVKHIRPTGGASFLPYPDADGLVLEMPTEAGPVHCQWTRLYPHPNWVHIPDPEQLPTESIYHLTMTFPPAAINVPHRIEQVVVFRTGLGHALMDLAHQLTAEDRRAHVANARAPGIRGPPVLGRRR
ncbi:hypothetical protein JCM10908_002230 [Rhodotorula pacifica]|uniref:uncharacterized protein n=1 Tax=Rhodotorula pacifica TaxID=1495444 RepID=UPI00316B4E01